MVTACQAEHLCLRTKKAARLAGSVCSSSGALDDQKGMGEDLLNLTFREHSEILGCAAGEFHRNRRAGQAAPCVRRRFQPFQKRNESPGKKKPRSLTYPPHSLEKGDCLSRPKIPGLETAHSLADTGLQGWLFAMPQGSSGPPPPHPPPGQLSGLRCRQVCS